MSQELKDTYIGLHPFIMYCSHN